jgi:hypothetical protein
MLILRILLALWTRLRLWMVTRAEARSDVDYVAKSLAVIEEAGRKPGNGRTLTTELENAERMRQVSRLMDARDTAQARRDRRAARCLRLDARLKKLSKPNWLLYPAGICDAVAGVTCGQLLTGWTVGDVAAWLGRLV